MSRAELAAARDHAAMALTHEEALLERWTRRLLAAAQQVRRRRQVVARRRKQAAAAEQALSESWRRPRPQEAEHAAH